MSSKQPIDLEDVRRLWQGQHESETQWNEKELLMEVQKKAKKFDRTLVWRDRREIAAALLTSSVMAVPSVMAPGWLPKVGALAVIAACAYVCVRLIRTRRRFPGPDAPMPLVDGLRAEIAKVEAQTELLDTVRDWYVLPIAAGGTVWLATLASAVPMPIGKALGVALAIAASVFIFTVVGIGVVQLNKWAVRKQLDPYRMELEGLLAQVET